MAKRRKPGEDSYWYDEKRKLHFYSISLPANGSGRRNRKTVSARTLKAAQTKRDAYKREYARGLRVTDERQTLDQWLDNWLTTIKRLQVRPLTYANYESWARRYILPPLGRYQLTKLTGPMLQSWISKLHDQGLSSKTIGLVRSLLKSCLEQALNDGLLTRNPAARLALPRSQETKIQILNVQQAKKLMEAAKGQRLEALFLVALSLGLRRGEVLALRWSDIDRARMNVNIVRSLTVVKSEYVFGEPKSKRSKRSVPLPDSVDRILTLHRARQDGERVVAGENWQENNLIFTTRTGRPLNPNSVSASFQVFLRRSGLPAMRFHDLRHSCASLLYALGVKIELISEILGHESSAMTERIYLHIFDRDRDEAAAKMNQLFESLESGSF